MARRTLVRCAAVMGAAIPLVPSRPSALGIDNWVIEVFLMWSFFVWLLFRFRGPLALPECRRALLVVAAAKHKEVSSFSYFRPLVRGISRAARTAALTDCEAAGRKATIFWQRAIGCDDRTDTRRRMHSIRRSRPTMILPERKRAVPGPSRQRQYCCCPSCPLLGQTPTGRASCAARRSH